jgi:hypothetical protein
MCHSRHAAAAVPHCDVAVFTAAKAGAAAAAARAVQSAENHITLLLLLLCVQL